MSASESSQFEGPEKLLEIWFAPSPAEVERGAPPTEDGKYGLRGVDRAVWEEMLDIVKCKILSVIEGSEIDAYLLRSVKFPLPRWRSAIHLTSYSFFYFIRSVTCRPPANRHSSSLLIVSS